MPLTALLFPLKLSFLRCNLVRLVTSCILTFLFLSTGHLICFDSDFKTRDFDFRPIFSSGALLMGPSLPTVASSRSGVDCHTGLPVHRSDRKCIAKMYAPGAFRTLFPVPGRVQRYQNTHRPHLTPFSISATGTCNPMTGLPPFPFADIYIYHQ